LRVVSDHGCEQVAGGLGIERIGHQVASFEDIGEHVKVSRVAVSTTHPACFEGTPRSPGDVAAVVGAILEDQGVA
jgi:hypothetical protein